MTNPTRTLDEAVELGQREVGPLLRQMLAFDTDIGQHTDAPRDDAAVDLLLA